VPVGSRPIPDSYIVVLQDDAAGTPAAPARSGLTVSQVAVDMAARYGASVTFFYEHALRGFAIRTSAASARALATDPRVKYVEQDAEMRIVSTQTGATWGLDRIDQRSLPIDTNYNYDVDGTGVNAYIIDTGIRQTHQDFGGRARSGYTAILDGNGTNDCHGHGTHVAGTVGGATWGVAKNVTLWAVRVLNCSGSGTISGVIAGVDWVTANHASPAVANMSLGGGASLSLDDAVRRSIASGVTYAIAAGNSNADACNASPARVAEALTAGASTSTDARASFSNYGSCLDVFAPGSSITSAWNTSDTATNTISGTSMASPHVAGVAALYLQQDPSASPATVASAVVNSATPGVVGSAGTGSPNRLLYSLFGTPPPPPPPSPDPCTGCEHYTGTLSGTGASGYQPNGTYYYSAAGTHQGWLRGPAATDFDLYLQRWNGFWWSVVARSESPTNEESITYVGSAGYYRWRIYAYSGSGAYDFWLIRP
jgi:subtilisin family serine protease